MSRIKYILIIVILVLFSVNVFGLTETLEANSDYSSIYFTFFGYPTGWECIGIETNTSTYLRTNVDNTVGIYILGVDNTNIPEGSTINSITSYDDSRRGAGTTPTMSSTSCVCANQTSCDCSGLQTLTTTFVTHSHTSYTNPSTGSAWQQDEIDDIYLKLTGTSIKSGWFNHYWTYIAHAYLVIDYTLPPDPCAYISGDWEIDMQDDCIISEFGRTGIADITPNKLVMTNSGSGGTLTIEADTTFITNSFNNPPSGSILYIGANSVIKIGV